MDAVFTAVAELYVILHIIGSHIGLSLSLFLAQLLSIIQPVIPSALTLEAIKGV